MNNLKSFNNLDHLSINIENFDGPIDLLFNLIKERKFDIMNIDLLYISITYIDYVKRNIFKMKIDDITEYLSMITYFFELKSKKILHQSINQEKLENEMDDDKFIQRILLQKQFRELVPNLSKKMDDRNKMLSKDADIFKAEDMVVEELPNSISPNVILKAMQNIFKKLNNDQNDIINIEINELSIDDITNEIIGFLSKIDNSNISLMELISSFPSRNINKQYLAVAFVALLVLVRNGNIVLEQDIISDNNIKIRKINLE